MYQQITTLSPVVAFSSSVYWLKKKSLFAEGCGYTDMYLEDSKKVQWFRKMEVYYFL